MNIFINKYHLVLIDMMPNLSFWSFIRIPKPSFFISDFVIMAPITIIVIRSSCLFSVCRKIWNTIFIISYRTPFIIKVCR